MNEEKQKKIRIQLINFMNQELIRNRKNKKSNFLINSMTLEQLEKKNMQCKDFYIEEKNQIYHNIDNGWTMGLNIYINNSTNNNPFIYSLSNIIKDDIIIKDIKNINKININKYDNNNKKTIIQKQSNKILYIQKEGNIGSPIETSLLIKKELGERKLKRTKNEFNSNKIPVSFSERLFNENNIENDKLKEKGNENNNISNHNINDIEDDLGLSKQYSNESLETQVSRIIKICHDDRYSISFEHYLSDSKISKQSKEIKIAKIYAKKLKCYCRTLKRKFVFNNDKNIVNKTKIKNNNYNDNNIIENENNINKDNIKKIINLITDKNNENKIIKKMSSFGLLNNLKKIEEKKNEENNLLENINYKQIIPYKKNKSERNVKLKIKTNNSKKKNKEDVNENNNITNSSNNNNQYRTLDDKKNNKRENNLFKMNKKKKRKTLKEENTSRTKLKLKKELIKSPPKIIKLKRNKKVHKNEIDLYLFTDSPKFSLNNLNKKKKRKENIIEKIKNKVSTEVNRENNLKRLIKFRKHLEEPHQREKSTNISSTKNDKKRRSLEKNNNTFGFEKLNFLKTKTKSTSEKFLFNKNKAKYNHNKLNSINYNTSISHKRDSSPSISIHKKYMRKNNKNKNNTNGNNNIRDKKKKKTFCFLNIKRGSAVVEALKKMSKKKSTNYDDYKPYDINKKLSSILNDNNKDINEKKKNTNNSKKISFKKNYKNEFNSEKINKENDIFNKMDEILYKKKHERSKKCNLFTID